jgi:signal transduction histidine kinase
MEQCRWTRQPSSWSVWLRSMRQRMEMLGGSLRVDSKPGAGTRVEVRVPLDGRKV